MAAKKTKEFRCPPREQMNAILAFKNLSEEELEEAPCGEEIKSKLLAFHGHLMVKAQIPGKKEEGDGKVCDITNVFFKFNYRYGLRSP